MTSGKLITDKGTVPGSTDDTRSLHIITGGSGHGKSRRLIDILLDSAADRPSDLFYLITPEQYSQSAQADIVRLSDRGGSLNIDVLSPTRLAFRILSEQGVPTGEALEDMGKSMLLTRVMMDVKDDLKLYRNRQDQPGFIDKLKSSLTEFYQRAVSPDDLMNLMNRVGDDNNRLLSMKLSDLLCIYRAFEEHLGRGVYVSETLLELASDYVKTSEKLRGAELFFDGFSGFTPNQYTFMDALFEHCGDIYITLCMDRETLNGRPDADKGLFTISSETYRFFEKHYAGFGNIITEPFMDRAFRWEKPCELSYLEDHVFRSSPVYTGESEHQIFISEFQDVSHEVETCAQEISRLIKGGYRFKDVAVACTDTESYLPVIERVFRDYGIPLFMDRSTRLLTNPYVNGLRAALEISVRGSLWDYDQIMRYVDSELPELTVGEAEALDDYLRATDTKGIDSWKKGFKRLPRSMWRRKRGNDTEQRQKDEDRRALYLRDINAIREKIAAPLLRLSSALDTGRNKNPDVSDFTAAVKDFLKDLDVENRIKSDVERMNAAESEGLALTSGSMTARAQIYSQVYDHITGLLRRLDDMIGDHSGLSVDEILTVFLNGLSLERLSITPSTLDQVSAGDLVRSRFDDVKAVFVLGLSDSYVPGNHSSPNLISDSDRKKLSSMDLPEELAVSLAPDAQRQLKDEQYYMYMTFSKPSERLYLSCSEGSEAGSGPCYIMERIRHMFPKAPALSHVSMYREGSQAYRNPDDDSISPVLAEKLYGKNLLSSGTALEEYAGCSFRYYLDHGLGLKPRDEYTFDVRDRGTTLHRVMELFTRNFMPGEDGSEPAYSYEDADVALIYDLTKQALDQAIEESHYEFEKGTRTGYQAQMMERIALRSTTSQVDLMKASHMKPCRAELDFGTKAGDAVLEYDISADTGTDADIRLRGTIDRLDTGEGVRKNDGTKDDTLYYRIVDYKTGSIKPEAARMLYGTQMQLIIYLLAAEQYLKGRYPDRELCPAGAMYEYLKDPIENVRETGEKVEETRRKLLSRDRKYEGLINTQDEALAVMDKKAGLLQDEFRDSEESGDKKSSRADLKVSDLSLDTLKVSYTSKGNIKAGSRNLSKTQLKNLMKLTEVNIKRLGSGILNGNVKVNPCADDKKGSKSPCDYCDYRSICRFDRDSGDSYEVLKPAKFADIAASKEDKEGKEDQ